MNLALLTLKWALAVVLTGLSCVAQASDLRLRDALQGGPYVLLMRHADAPGFGDPAGYTLGDCASQRNLGDTGRAQARAIGQWLQAQGLRTARVYASPWCRCVDTARLLGLGEVRREDSLGSFFNEPAQGTAQTGDLRRFIANSLQAPFSTLPLVLVTHQVNITAYVGETVATGDMVLVQVDGEGRAVRHTRLRAPTP